MGFIVPFVAHDVMAALLGVALAGTHQAYVTRPSAGAAITTY